MGFLPVQHPLGTQRVSKGHVISKKLIFSNNIYSNKNFTHTRSLGPKAKFDVGASLNLVLANARFPNITSHMNQTWVKSKFWCGVPTSPTPFQNPDGV